MSQSTEQRMSQQAQAEPGASEAQKSGSDEVSEGTRPQGTVDEDSNPPLTDPTTTEVDRNPELVPPRDSGHAVPPYEGRK
jgi:hypothetical protein